MERKTIDVVLNEVQFSNVCKSGFLPHSNQNGRSDITFTKKDIKDLMIGKPLVKEVGDDFFSFKFLLHFSFATLYIHFH